MTPLLHHLHHRPMAVGSVRGDATTRQTVAISPTPLVQAVQVVHDRRRPRLARALDQTPLCLNWCRGGAPGHKGGARRLVAGLCHPFCGTTSTLVGLCSDTPQGPGFRGFPYGGNAAVTSWVTGAVPASPCDANPGIIVRPTKG